jgi:hypothetical protein
MTDLPPLPPEESRMVLLASRKLIEERGFGGDHLDWSHSIAVDNTMELVIGLFLLRAGAYFHLWFKQDKPYEDYCAWLHAPAIRLEVTNAVQDLWRGHGGLVFQGCLLRFHGAFESVINKCCAQARDAELERLQSQSAVEAPKAIALGTDESAQPGSDALPRKRSQRKPWWLKKARSRERQSEKNSVTTTKRSAS